MYLLDESYFHGLLSIANLGEPKSKVYKKLEMYVNEKVRLFLESLLGNEQFKEFDSHVVKGKLQDTAPQKWKDLVNGCDYTIGEQTYTFRGLLEVTEYSKKSLLAFLVFHSYHTDDVTQVTGVGEVVLKGKNAINVNPAPRLTRVWNEFVKMYQGTHGGAPIKYTHCGVIVSDYLGGEQGRYSTLLTFLEHNHETYKGFNRLHFRFINQFGLV